MEQKLQDLKERFEQGQQQLAVLEQRRTELRDSLLRLSGAIQVLEELKAADGNTETDSVAQAPPVSVVRNG
jgi:prefoldin subunit 5